MKELLKRWTEIEPGVCRVISASSDSGVKVKILPDLLFWHWIEFTDGELSLMDTAVLQFAVQQAIVARGWYFDVAYLPLHPGDDKYHADIQVIGAYLQATKSDNPAEALLSAYLKALDGVARKG